MEYAKARGWKVVAGNVPRKIASTVFSKGIEAVNQLPDSSRRWAAEESQCAANCHAIAATALHAKVARDRLVVSLSQLRPTQAAPCSGRGLTKRRVAA